LHRNYWVTAAPTGEALIRSAEQPGSMVLSKRVGRGVKWLDNNLVGNRAVVEGSDCPEVAPILFDQARGYPRSAGNPTPAATESKSVDRVGGMGNKRPPVQQQGAARGVVDRRDRPTIAADERHRRGPRSPGGHDTGNAHDKPEGVQIRYQIVRLRRSAGSHPRGGPRTLHMRRVTGGR